MTHVWYTGIGQKSGFCEKPDFSKQTALPILATPELAHDPGFVGKPVAHLTSSA